MKRIVLILSVFFAFAQTLKAQTVDSTGIKDSVEITLSIQARDVEYISGFIWNNDFYENLVDSIKPAYRKLVNPTATTTYNVTVADGNGCEATTSVTVTVHPLPAANITGDTEICTGATTRLISLLSALNIPYINTKITEFNNADNSQFQYGKSAGKRRLVKKK